LKEERSEEDSMLHVVSDQIWLTRRLSKRTFALFLLCGAPSWAVVPATVVASLGHTPLQQDNAEFLPAVILLIADDGVALT
jgi:hypothetical protein